MPITLGSNIASLTAQRRLAEGTSQLSKTYERLSSGLRINRASDDAAGLAISDSLRADSRILNQGVRNLNDGISLLNIADSSIENLTSIVVRLEELAEQAANGTYGATQRKAIDAEAQALSKEFFRISKTTSFNGQQLLSGGFDQVNLQAGYGANSVLSAGVGGAIGTGTFTKQTSFVTESDISYDVEFADFNGDGNLDMVTGGSDDGGIGYMSVRLGTGSGAFGASTKYAMDGNRSRAVSIGDLNGDGKMDIMTTGFTGIGFATTTTRLGNGDGTFGQAVSYSGGGTYFFGGQLGDLDNDGDLDIATAGFTQASTGYAHIRLNDGSGNFGSALSYATEAYSSTDLALGDINNDGNIDLVTVGDTSATAGFMTVRLGNGNGTFGSATSYAMESTASRGIALGDVNQDGLLDAVSSGGDGTVGRITVRLGNGNGTFGGATSYSTSGIVVSNEVRLGDLNGDGLLDVISADGLNTGGSISVLTGNGNGTFNTARSYSAEGGRSEAVGVADINKDGVSDLVSVGYATGTDGYASVFFGDTRNGVAPLQSFSLRTSADALQALPMFKNKRDQLAAQRGQIGAFQSRIGVATNVLQVTSENFKAAESRIRDADIAHESSQLTRLNILQQAAASVLAQANQQPALAIRLLGGV